MIINSINIKAFGSLEAFFTEFSSGLNVVEGDNEAGKSTVWAFVRFIFYGLDKAGRERYIPWGKDACGGSLTLTHGDRVYRIERELLASRPRDTVGIYDATGALQFAGQSPADVFLGVPEHVFVNTAFTPQFSAAVSGQNMPQAMENILFSADEMVNTGKALKALDDMRVTLLHKNKKGGAIFTLENTAAGLEITLEETKRSAARIFELEERIRAAENRRAENREKCALISAQLDEYEAYSDMECVARTRAAQAKLDALYADKAALERSFSVNGFLPDAAYVAGLKAFENEAAEADSNTVKADGALAAAQTALAGCSGSDAGKRIEAAGGAERISGLIDGFRAHIGRNRVRSTAFWLISLVPLAAGLIFAFMYEQYIASAVCGAMFLALLIAAVLFGAKASKMKHSLSLLYAKFGADDGDALSLLLENAGEADDVRRAAQAAVDACREACVERRADKAALEERLAEYTKSYKPVGTSGLGAHIDETEGILSTLSAAGAEVEKQEYAVRLLTEKSASVNPEATKARLRGKLKPQDVGAFDVANKRLELNMLSAANESLSEKINDGSRELAAAKATQTTSPAAVADKLNAVRAQLDAAKTDYDAYVLASDKLKEASVRLRESVSPRLCALAGKYMSAFTDGRYDSLGVSHELELTFTADGFTHPADSFSGGTLDAAYICLRLALCDVLYLKGSCPVFFDDAFVRADDKRLTYIMTSLHHLSPARQIVIFTCHRREGFIASKLGDRVVRIAGTEAQV